MDLRDDPLTGPDTADGGALSAPQRLTPAAPLWRLAPTRGSDGRALADFMMLIPGLGARPPQAREHIAMRVREVCEAYGPQVAFADINYSINVLWVSVLAEPGLAGRVAQSIRGRVPEALLIGGQLASTAVPVARGERRHIRFGRRVRSLTRRVVLMLGGPSG